MNRTHLKFLAIIAMVSDHIAWGFLDFMSPLSQIMHIFGRLTLPIMCFFIAEGFRHTSNLKRYIGRMVTFAIISIVPFYIFFHAEYDFRQNIIFDLLLALLALAAMENKKWHKAVRILIVAGLFCVSAAIGGWVIMPIVYVLIFYYSKSFKKAARSFCICTCLMEIVLIAVILLNQKYHFSHYDWTVQERLYLLGFMLALIPLYFYNGQKGKGIGGRYFFYIFYPAHFLALAFVKLLATGTAQEIYIWIHVAALFVVMLILGYVIQQRASRAQMTTVFFMTAATMYVFGFLLEITTDQVAGVYTATKLQYFSECLVFIALSMVIQEFCRRRVPYYVYAGEIVCSVLTMYFLFTYEDNHLFYSGVSMNTTAGSFPRMQIESYGPAFYAFLAYIVVSCSGAIITGFVSSRGNRLLRKRLRLLLGAMVLMWFPYVIKSLNLTNGYEIPALGVAASAICVGLCVGKYSFLDSVHVSYENAINHGTEGIMTIDNRHHVMYHNEWMHSIFGVFSDYEDIYNLPNGREILSGEISQMEKDGHTYEMRMEPLTENGESLGTILWVFDMTEHYKYLEKVKETATVDTLTGVLNRGAYEQVINDFLAKQGSGAMLMLDLDNFKRVNDTYGHQAGDEALKTLGRVLTELDSSVIKGRVGGDEFSIFVKDQLDKDSLSQLAEHLIRAYSEELKKTENGSVTSLTVGIALIDQRAGSKEMTYEHLFKRADRALYAAKEAGKTTYRFYSK